MSKEQAINQIELLKADLKTAQKHKSETNEVWLTYEMIGVRLVDIEKALKEIES